jgi:hypothetical protein
MKTDLTLPCLIFMIITIYLYYHSKTNDKYLLSIMIFGQFILLFGSLIKNDYLIEIAHIVFWISIIIGIFFFKEKYNKYFIVFTLLIILLTRQYFGDCLFLMANGNKKLINLNIDYDKFVYFLLFILIVKELLNNL